MKKKRKKQFVESEKSLTAITKRQKRFCEYISQGLSPREAFLSAGFSRTTATSKPYQLLKKDDLKGYIQALIDRHIPTIVRNDIKLARLKIHEGEGADIAPSLITDAKQRLYDRSSLGPVIRKEQTVTASIDISPEIATALLNALREDIARELSQSGQQSSQVIDITPAGNEGK